MHSRENVWCVYIHLWATACNYYIYRSTPPRIVVCVHAPFSRLLRTSFSCYLSHHRDLVEVNVYLPNWISKFSSFGLRAIGKVYSIAGVGKALHHHVLCSFCKSSGSKTNSHHLKHSDSSSMWKRGSRHHGWKETNVAIEWTLPLILRTPRGCLLLENSHTWRPFYIC
jgi:hypothetical protein